MKHLEKNEKHEKYMTMPGVRNIAVTSGRIVGLSLLFSGFLFGFDWLVMHIFGLIFGAY